MNINLLARGALGLLAWLAFAGVSAGQWNNCGSGFCPIKGTGGGGGGGTVTVQDVNARTKSSAGVSTVSTTADLAAGLTNPALIGMLIQCDGTFSSPSMSWDSAGTPQAMTLIGSANFSSVLVVSLFGLRNPTVSGLGVHYSASWTGAAQVVTSVMSLSGVNQTSDAAAFKNFNSTVGSSGPGSVTITSATGHQVVAGFADVSNFSSVNHNQWFIDNSCNSWPAAANYADGASTVTMTASPGTATFTVAAGVDVSP